MAMQSAVGPRRPLLTRQLSLHQSNLPLQPPPPLRKQLSEEHPRPRPRQAWTNNERRPTPPGAVELVARKVERPSSAAPSVPQQHQQQQLVAALATRQELAERLRRAWREGQAKQGLDIFLSRTEEEDAKQQEDVDQTSTQIQASRGRLEIVLAPRASSPPAPPPPETLSVSTTVPVRALSAGARRVNFRNSKSTSSSSLCPPPPVIKNKPLRVKSARRPKTRRQESSEEETTAEETPKRPPGRRGVSARCEIITQISLMSSTESECEDDTKVQPLLALESPKAEQQPLVMCLRKANKTVSFQKPGEEPETEEGSLGDNIPTMGACRPQSSILSSRRRPPLQRQLSAPAASTSGVAPVNGVPTGVLITGHRPLEVSSPPSIVVDSLQAKAECGDGSSDANVPPHPSRPPGPPAAGGSEQPEDLRSPKERECWLLYRRMVDKGIAVSFETILRGMLTPTEYRQRRAVCLSQPSKSLEEAAPTTT